MVVEGNPFTQSGECQLLVRVSITSEGVDFCLVKQGETIASECDHSGKLCYGVLILGVVRFFAPPC